MLFARWAEFCSQAPQAGALLTLSGKRCLSAWGAHLPCSMVMWKPRGPVTAEKAAFQVLLVGEPWAPGLLISPQDENRRAECAPSPLMSCFLIITFLISARKIPSLLNV